MTSTYTHPGSGIWAIEPPTNLTGWRSFPDEQGGARRHLARRVDDYEEAACGANISDSPVAGREYDMLIGQHASDDYCVRCQHVLARHAADTIR